MTYEEFKRALMGKLEEELAAQGGGYILGTEKVDKLGRSYDGLIIKQMGKSTALSLDLEDVYNDFSLEEGRTGRKAALEKRSEDVLGMIRSGFEHIPELDEKKITDYENIRKKFVLQAVSIFGNGEKLQDVPHRITGDMALVVRFETKLPDGRTGSGVITNELVRSWGIEPETLFKDAMEAAPCNEPALLETMAKVMEEMTGEPVPGPGPKLYVATVRSKINGAAVMAYPGFMEEAAREIGSSYYILPSSIHEVLLLADIESPGLETLEGMVRSVNRTQVAPEERLSDTVYHYDARERKLEPAEQFEKRMAARQSREPQRQEAR